MHKPKREDGLVAIVVVTMVIIILSLMTVGFTRVMDRGFRQAIDRELATQANYAAESGLNDSRAFVAEKIKNNRISEADTGGNCKDLSGPSVDAPFLKNGTLSGDYNNAANTDNLVKYTCVIIDTAPNELIYDIPAGESRLFKVVTDQPADSLYFGWENANRGANPGTLPGNPNVASKAALPTQSVFNAHPGTDEKTGVLRATVYPITSPLFSNAASDQQNQKIQDLSRTMFLYPNLFASAGVVNNVDYDSGTADGSIVAGNCNTGNFTTTALDSSIPYKNGTKRFCNSKIGGMVPPSPPAPSATGTSVTYRVEGRQGFSNINVRVVVSQAGQPDYTLDNTTYNPSSLASTGSGSCGINGDGLQKFQVFTKSSFAPLPAAYTHPFIKVLFTGVDDYNVAQGDNNVIVQSASLTYDNGATNSLDAISNSAWPGSTTSPVQMCGTGTVTLTDLSPPPAPTPPDTPEFYYVRLTALYHDLSVSVQASDTLGGSLKFNNAEATIDVTAQANDILKRVRSRVALDTSYSFPEYGLQSMDTLCKKLRLPKTGPGSSDFGKAVYDDTDAAADTTGFYLKDECSAGGVLSP